MPIFHIFLGWLLLAWPVKRLKWIRMPRVWRHVVDIFGKQLWKGPISQIILLQQIPNSLSSLAHTVVKAAKFFHITPILKSLFNGSTLMNALNINYCHLPSKFSQPSYLTVYTTWSLFSLHVEPAPRLVTGKQLESTTQQQVWLHLFDTFKGWHEGVRPNSSSCQACEWMC